MGSQFPVGDITVNVTLKDIKNIHLRVRPPTGEVRLSAPRRVNAEALWAFAVSRAGWIKRQQRKLRAQTRETARHYVSRESHYVWGQRCLLSVVERNLTPTVEQQHTRLRMRVRPGTDTSRRKTVLESWYRTQLKQAVPPLLKKWQATMGVEVTQWYVRRMKTKWGSCNYRARTIRLNTELAKKPRECLEYVVVHELVHLLEPSHNDRFRGLMDRYLPKWQLYRDTLNEQPLPHDQWTY
jgi:predicted metal-dependent hydrolase